jgi:PPK2 family polyphosphate:nucleotide phosphotransferase
MKLDHSKFLVRPGKKFRLKDRSTADGQAFRDRDHAEVELSKDVARLAKLQEKLYAQDVYGFLIVFQAMDAAGKDGAIKHVMSGVNPQGCQVATFKAPSTEELDHDYLWRCNRHLPERGRIGIFNRSYYEEVLVVRVHPELLEKQHLPPEARGKDVWQQRYREINAYERYLVDNGIVIVKFFLNVSKDEQKRRFLERIQTPEKNWKFSAGDVRERERWKDYMQAYQDAIEATSTKWAPWYVIPADVKWYTRAAVADVVCARLEELQLHYPKVTREQRAQLTLAAKSLVEE